MKLKDTIEEFVKGQIIVKRVELVMWPLQGYAIW